MYPKLLPVIGSQISSGLDFLNNNISDGDLNAKCCNISHFGVNPTIFD